MTRLRAILPSVPVALVVAVTTSVGTHSPAGAAAEPTTTIVIRVAGCENCLVIPQSFVQSADLPYSRVSGGVVRLRVPRSLTPGLGFQVVDQRPQVDKPAEIYAVARYAGRRPGQRVSSRFAARATAARQCWAGTRRAKVVLRMRVDRFPVTAIPGYNDGVTEGIRPFFVRSLTTIGAPWRTANGALGAQGIVGCSG